MKDHGANSVPRGPSGRYEPTSGHSAEGCNLNIRVTAAQRDRWKREARALGITLTELVVRRMEGR